MALFAAVAGAITGLYTGLFVTESIRSPIGNAIPNEYTIPAELRFSAGDIVSCRIHWAASHIFLASSSSTVFHAPGISEDRPGETRLKEDIFDEVSRQYTRCAVITEFYDKQYASRCGGRPFNTTEVVRRAQDSLEKFRGKYTHCDQFKCNYEHWVSAWRYGTSWTLQAGASVLRSKYKSNQCEAPGLQDCLSRE